jgi:hypothetical protein
VKKLANSIIKQYLDFRFRRLRRMRKNPYSMQKQWLQKILQMAKNTEYGKKYGFREIKNYRDFAERVPVTSYEELQVYIDRMMRGEKDILWPGYVKWYAKSSGTTSHRSKFIPVPSHNLRQCHIQGSWDSMSTLYHHRPDMQAFAKKSLIMGGSIEKFAPHPKTRLGDVSAVMIHHMPFIGKPFYTPDFETALLSDWEEKLHRMASITHMEDVVMLGGVPTWTVVLFDRILELTGKEHMLEVWPNASAYLHGGVGFAPYQKQFERYLPSSDFVYQEIYNASEGFIGLQDDHAIKALLLLTDNGMFFEFEAMDSGEVVPLEGVKTGQNYALLLSTNAGLWRYRIGDTIRFTSTLPHRFHITGRTKQFINAFGEEVMVANTDQALAQTCRELNVEAEEYSVGPIYMDKKDKGGHEWIVEFQQIPENIDHFARRLDKNLRAINSDYDAKRSYDLALENLRLHPAAAGTFHSWMKSRGKFGGQNKVPRLSNDRRYIDQLLTHLAKQTS